MRLAGLIAALLLLAGSAEARYGVVSHDAMGPLGFQSSARFGEAVPSTAYGIGRYGNSVARRSWNILIWIWDDVGKESLDIYGATDTTTPTIDSLAAAGITFSSMYDAPVCGQGRATFISGRRAFRHENFSQTGNDLSVSELGIAKAVQYAQNGYRSGWFGKIGVACGASCPGDDVSGLSSHGFDRLWGTAGPGLADYDDYTSVEFFSSGTPAVVSTANVTDYVTEEEYVQAIAWLQSLPDGQPWLLVMSARASHAQGADFPIPTDDPCGPTQVCQAAMTDHMDVQGALLMAEVDTSNTLVMAFGDNGDVLRSSAGCNGLLKASSTECGVNVPFVAAYGDIPTARRGDSSDSHGAPMGEITDVWQTVADYAGAKQLPTRFPVVTGDTRFTGQTIEQSGQSLRTVLVGDGSEHTRDIQWGIIDSGADNEHFVSDGTYKYRWDVSPTPDTREIVLLTAEQTDLTTAVALAAKSRLFMELEEIENGTEPSFVCPAGALICEGWEWEIQTTDSCVTDTTSTAHYGTAISNADCKYTTNALAGAGSLRLATGADRWVAFENLGATESQVTTLTWISEFDDYTAQLSDRLLVLGYLSDSTTVFEVEVRPDSPSRDVILQALRGTVEDLSTYDKVADVTYLNCLTYDGATDIVTWKGDLDTGTSCAGALWSLSADGTATPGADTRLDAIWFNNGFGNIGLLVDSAVATVE